MPRKRRFHLPGVPVHVVQRGNNRAPSFFSDTDRLAYLDFLSESCGRYGVEVHAWVLMTNHVHLLVSPQDRDSLTLMMQWLGAKYVRLINHIYGRTGCLWESRYKGCLIDTERYMLACMRYIELNPVRAGMVAAPADYRWSSFHCNAFGAADKVTRPHPLYLALGENPLERQYAYREAFRGHMDNALLHQIRTATHTGTPLGNDRFREQIEEALGRKVGWQRRGRPRKAEQIEFD